jgi:hypothetical protein
MNAIFRASDTDRYARCIGVSKRLSWVIEDDVDQGRGFRRSDKYLPDGLSLVPVVTTLRTQ